MFEDAPLSYHFSEDFAQSVVRPEAPLGAAAIALDLVFDGERIGLRVEVEVSLALDLAHPALERTSSVEMPAVRRRASYSRKS